MSEHLKFMGVDVVLDPDIPPGVYEYYFTREGDGLVMKISEIEKPKFDPYIRIKEAKVLHVSFTPAEWASMEERMGKYISPTEIRELILGVFAGEFKIVKR